MFILRKDRGPIPEILTQILDSCVNGVTLADPDLPDSPVVYANKAFEQITGYAAEEIVGRNCRFLQGPDHDQPARAEIRAAMAAHKPIETILRNYRKNGEAFSNRLSITPLFGPDGGVIYYLGVQYDVTAQVAAQDEILRLGARLKSFEQA